MLTIQTFKELRLSRPVFIKVIVLLKFASELLLVDLDLHPLLAEFHIEPRPSNKGLLCWPLTHTVAHVLVEKGSGFLGCLMIDGLICLPCFRQGSETVIILMRKIVLGFPVGKMLHIGRNSVEWFWLCMLRLLDHVAYEIGLQLYISSLDCVLESERLVA